MITKAQEKRAQRLVLESIESALSEMREYIQRELLAGRELDKRMMITLSRGLSDLADTYSIDLMAGPYGDMIEAAMKAAVAEVADIGGGIALTVGRREVEAALTKSGWLVKGILEEGQRVVSEEVLKAIVGGKSQRDVADSIAARLQVKNDAGELGAIPAWRAELIARNELMNNYRGTSFAAAEEAGFSRYRMYGPDDDRTDGDVCARYLGQEHTVEEWNEIAAEEGVNPAYPLLDGWGFHVNCRHNWLPVAESLNVEVEA